MNLLYLDIETIPAGEESHAKLKYLYERKKKKHTERYAGDDDAEEFMTLEEFIDKTGTDGSFGRIVCIGYALNNSPAEILSGTEERMLERFWEIASSVDLFVGHNIRDFDLPFIMQRSMVLGVKPSWVRFEEPGIPKYKMNKFLDFARYKSAPIFDIMWEWNHWKDKWDNKTIEHVAMAMDIETPKQGIDGSQVFEFYKKGKLDEIMEYCKRDVETNRAVYKRMTFESAPTRETLPF